MKNLRITVEGKVYDVQVELLDEDHAAPAPRRASSGASSRVAAPAPKKAASSAAKAAPAPSGDGAILSPLAAVVVSVDVAVGDTVEAGQKVATLEAMKMNTIVSSTVAGTVKAILVSAGDGVEEGQAILEIA
ncbi:MAG TPA: biotin/lipoyl-containing protein [Opitutales bacterium]|nr:biotin/lipoyl-containing protein [Opitutales bacterium]